MKKRLAIYLLTVLLLAMPAAAQRAAKKTFTNAGFYDGIVMTSKESGDYGGIAVFVTQSDTETFALVSVAEGAELDPILVPAKLTGKNMRNIEFTYSSPSYGREMKLTGTITAAGMRLSGYGDKPVMLTRKCANAYSGIAVGKESGDYGGIEVFLTDTGPSSWFALVTTAEGVINKPVLVEAKVTGKNYDRVEFELPSADGARKFTGTISHRARTLTLDEAGTKTVLRAKCYK